MNARTRSGGNNVKNNVTAEYHFITSLFFYHLPAMATSVCAAPSVLKNAIFDFRKQKNKGNKHASCVH